MADLLIKIGTVGPDPNWQDGDLVCAFNERRILCCHAEHICHPWKHSRTRHGLRPDGLPRDFHELTHQYRFERVSETEIKRTDLTTGKEEILGPKPNDAGEYMDVPEFVRRRMREFAPDGGPRLALFGLPGAEIWYGGTIDVSPAKVASVWDMIEGNTLKRREDHVLWPFSSLEHKHFLPIKTDDFDDLKADELHGSEIVVDAKDPEQPAVMLKRRLHKVDWKEAADAAGIAQVDVLDRTKEIDARIVELDSKKIITQKARVKDAPLDLDAK